MRQAAYNLHISWASYQAGPGGLSHVVKTANFKAKLCRFDTLTTCVNLGPVIHSLSLGFICKMGIITQRLIFFSPYYVLGTDISIPYVDYPILILTATL